MDEKLSALHLNGLIEFTDEAAKCASSSTLGAASVPLCCML